MTDMQKWLKLSLGDLADDVIKLVPKWKEEKGPLVGEGKIEPIESMDVPRMKIKIEVAFIDEEAK